MNNRDYYKVLYSSRDSDKTSLESHDFLDNDTEFNANQFKLYDDFTTDLRMNFNPMRHNYHDVTRRSVRRTSDKNDSGIDMENGNTHDDSTVSRDVDLLENEVMVDPWSSMDSSNSPLTDSGPSASEDCTPSTSSEIPRRSLDVSSPLSPESRRIPDPVDTKPKVNINVTSKISDKARSRDLTLELETLDSDSLPRRSHFLDECRIPKPHFLDHSPSPDEFDERSDITNPNFLDDVVDGDDNQAQKKSGALPKRPQKSSTSTFSHHEDRPHRTSYRSTLHYGLESAARSSERDKRASQLYRGTWPGERDVWMGHDSASVRSFSSNGSAEGARASSNLENKMECVCSLISLLSLSPENNADLSGPLLDMSRSVESCIAMRQAGCIPLLVQLIHSKVPRETRDRAAKALRNIIHTQTDDKAGRREARVWRLLEQVREYCYVLEDLVEARKEDKEVIEDDVSKHPSQSVAALMKLSFDEEHRHVVCQLGGLQALAALVSGDQAAHGSRTDDNTCLTMRKYAGMTLTNLTFGDGNNKSLLCSFKDFMLALVEQLESPNDDMRQVTAAVLRNLSWRADTNSKQVLREVGAVKGLTKAAMTCQKEATLKSVLSALWNLTAHCSLNKVALCSVDGALGFLVDMLSYNSPTKTLAIVENAGGIMRNVSSHIAVREDYRQILRERNCLSVLLQHLKSPSLTVVSNSCGTLWNLSARCPQDQQFLWDHGAVPMLRSLIHSKHKMIAMGSGAALKNLLNSKPGKTHIISLDTTARCMNLPALPTLGARKQKALEQELDQNLAETCDNIEPATSPTTSNREEKNLFTATERQIAMNLERHRMTSSSPLMGTLTSQISLSHSAHLASYLSCSNTLLKGALVSRSNTGSAGNVNRSDSKDSVTSTHSDTVFERVMRTGKVPVPTPRNKDLMKSESTDAYKMPSKCNDNAFVRYSTQPPVPTPRSTTEMRTNYTESGFDVDQDSCDQPIDYSRKYSESKTAEVDVEKQKSENKKYSKKESSSYGDYQETDLDQPTDYSLRYGELQSETGSDTEAPGPSVHEDTIQHFATEGTPYETPVIFSTATSMSDLRVIGKDKSKMVSSVKENPEIMTHSDEKDTCSIEDPPRHDNDLAATTPQSVPTMEPIPEKRGIFDTKFSSGMISPEKPVNYCDEGTPGYFSRVSSLSSLGEPTEEDSLAKRNAMATIAVDPSPPEQSSSISKDREGCKAVTFASSPVTTEEQYVEETPLMFSRSSSLGSVPDGDQHDDQGSVLSELSRMTSGCVSPSEIPDSPGVVSPPGPPAALSLTHSPPPDERHTEDPCAGSVFEERVSQFVVENTPAQFSRNTSLSSLTIDCDAEDQLPKLSPEKQESSDIPLHEDRPRNVSTVDGRSHIQIQSTTSRICHDIVKDSATEMEECRVYVTEDTPRLSMAGSHSNLSALSIESRPPALDEHHSSDSSNLSDAGDLLEECIQKGIAKVVKNKAPQSESSSIMNPYRDNVYRSLPAYLRSSTETVKMSHEFARNMPDSRSGSSERSPPPLPPRAAGGPAAPPAPERASRARRRRSSSGSSPSAESFGSTDREIFEQVVRAGVGARRPRSLQRARAPSLSSLSNDSFGSTDKEVFERCVRLGMAAPRARSHERPSRRRRRPRRAAPAPAAAPAPGPAPAPPKNVPEPSAERAPAGEPAPTARPPAGCEPPAPLTLLTAGDESDRDERDPSRTSEAGEPPRRDDTWNDNTCLDDVTFPTISGSVHLESSLPDLVETGEPTAPALSRPDLTSRLEALVSPEIEREAARLAAALHAAPAPACLSWDDARRKRPLPPAVALRRADRLDSEPLSLLDNVKPPSEMDIVDLESSMISVSSIASEVAPAPLTFELGHPVREFSLCGSLAALPDLDAVNPPSLFDEMMESTLEPEPSRPDDCPSTTLRAVGAIPSDSETGTPLPSDLSSVESTPTRRRDPAYLTPKERRQAAKDRFQTYTISDAIAAVAAPEPDEDVFLTWTETAEEPPQPAAAGAPRVRRRLSAKQRRAEDRARYQTQTVDARAVLAPPAAPAAPAPADPAPPTPDPAIDSLKRRLAAKKTSKQRRLEDADRFRTRTLSEDVPPSPTYVTKDANFENLETTTGYDSLSSNEPSHQRLTDRPEDDATSRDADSGLTEDDFELNSSRMRTYTKSFRTYLPVVESPAAVDMCVLNNLKNIELTASYRRESAPADGLNPSSGDFASYDGDSNSDDRPRSESDADSPRPKPKIINPTVRRDESLDSNDSLDREPEAPKAIRGRKKAAYVSPYRRSAPPAVGRKPPAGSKPGAAIGPAAARTHSSAKPAAKTPMASKPLSATTSPKKSIPHGSPSKAIPKASSISAVAAKPLPLERQGTFTKEESTVPAKDLPVPDVKPTAQRVTKTTPASKTNISPSRLPQMSRYARPQSTKTINKSPTKIVKKPETTMKNSASNHSLQSNDSGKTVTLASRSSRQGSTSSVNSVQLSKTKDVESKIANLWKKVEQAKKQPAKADKRVWIESDKAETPRLIRSSTFEGQPKQSSASPAGKQKSAIGIRVSQIPSLRPKSTPSKITPPSTAKKTTTTGRVFARKPISGQIGS